MKVLALLSVGASMIPHYKLSSYLAVKVISKFESKGDAVHMR